MNTARSALSTLLGPVEGITLGSHPLVCRLLKGVSRLRPPKSKYSCTWDPKIVLDYIQNHLVNDLTLRQLSMKLVALLLLCSGQRVQTISMIKVKEISFSSLDVQIRISARLKTSKPGIGTVLVFKKFEKQEICVFTCLSEYVTRTCKIRDSDFLLVSTKCPYKKASSQTISHWAKDILLLSGVDTNTFSSHSFRHSATSKAANLGVSMDTIMCSAGWTKTSKVFANFYHRPLLTSDDFGLSILRNQVT